MKKVTAFDYNGFCIEFEARPEGVYANATAMCQANERLVANWLQLDSAKEYAALVAETYNIGFPILSKKGKGGGTWIHEKMIIELARWISPRFALWCDEKVSELLRTGSVSLTPRQRQAERLRKKGRDEGFIAMRCESTDTRNHFTSVLKAAGVSGAGYSMCTRAIYAPLFGGDGSARFIRGRKGLSATAPVRDAMDRVELAAVSLAEALGAERIQKNRCCGEVACASACRACSLQVARALVSERKLSFAN